MSQLSSKNTHTTLNPIVWQVLDILWIEKSSYKDDGNQYKKQIHTIIGENPTAKDNLDLVGFLIEKTGVDYVLEEFGREILQDRKIAMMALARDPNVFFRLSPKQKLDIKFAQVVIQSMIRNGVSFFEVEDFVSQNFSSKKMVKKLMDFYAKGIEIFKKLNQTDANKNLSVLEQKNPKIYKKIRDSNIVSQSGSRQKLSADFIQMLPSQLSLFPDFESLTKTEQDQILSHIVLSYMGLTESDMSSELQVFLDNILSLIDIHKHIQSMAPSEPQEQEEWDDAEQEPQEEEQEDEIENRMEYVLPTYNYRSGDSQVQIDIWQGKKIQFSQHEFQQINNTALKNYIQSAETLEGLGLGFVFQYREQFFWSICGLEYMYWEWLNQAMMLRILNKIGKNIGIPEKKYVQQDDDAPKEVGCFNRVEEAIHHFKGIRDTGKLQDTLIVEPFKRGTKSVLRHVLEYKWLLDREGMGFYNSMWS